MLEPPSTSLLEEWQNYRKQHPAGYCYFQFSNLYGQWLSTNRLKRLKKPLRSRWAKELSTEDIKVLKAWRSSNNKRKWERAVALQDLHEGCTIASICRKLERSPKTIKEWRRTFVTQRLDKLATPLKRAVNFRTPNAMLPEGVSDEGNRRAGRPVTRAPHSIRA